MKHGDLRFPRWDCHVAPHAGAWIETRRKGSAGNVLDVAPHAGAWIETACRRRCGMSCARRPPCGGVD